MPKPAVSATISKTGPFFKGDPVRRFRSNIKVMMDDVAAEGQKDVQNKLRSGQGRRAPVYALRRSSRARVADNVVGRTKSLSGKQWKVTATVSVNAAGLPKAARTSLFVAAARVERQTGAFRRANVKIDKAASKLLEGVA